MPVEIVATIAALRRRRKSSLQISFSLSLPISSVTLELRRLGLNKLSRLEPKPPVIRYEHKNPGDMIHLDIKKLGKIDGVGHRITADRSKRGRKAGWEYLHVCVDDNSRASYSELLPDEKATSAACFMIRAVGWFERHGVEVGRVLTDNGSCYRSHLFMAACQYLGVRPKKTRPYIPQNCPSLSSLRAAPLTALTCLWRYANTWVSGPTRPGPMAKLSASSREVSRNGLTAKPTNHRRRGEKVPPDLFRSIQPPGPHTH